LGASLCVCSGLGRLIQWDGIRYDRERAEIWAQRLAAA
jgi:hypothetical protein